MTPDEGFLQAIIENPDDDAPRLVYADFLEEHGQAERAEFIRVECKLARTPEADTRRVALEAKERELLMTLAKELAGPLYSPLLHWQFRRGLIDRLAHSGIFQCTQAIEVAEDYQLWSYLRFCDDGHVFSTTSEGTPVEVSRWFRRPERPSSGRYRVWHGPQGTELSFRIETGYGMGCGFVDFKGTLEVRADLFDEGTEVKLVLDVHQHYEKTTISEVFKLVELPG